MNFMKEIKKSCFLFLKRLNSLLTEPRGLCIALFGLALLLPAGIDLCATPLSFGYYRYPDLGTTNYALADINYRGEGPRGEPCAVRFEGVFERAGQAYTGRILRSDITIGYLDPTTPGSYRVVDWISTKSDSKGNAFNVGLPGEFFADLLGLDNQNVPYRQSGRRKWISWEQDINQSPGRKARIVVIPLRDIQVIDTQVEAIYEGLKARLGIGLPRLYAAGLQIRSPGFFVWGFGPSLTCSKLIPQQMFIP